MKDSDIHKTFKRQAIALDSSVEITLECYRELFKTRRDLIDRETSQVLLNRGVWGYYKGARLIVRNWIDQSRKMRSVKQLDEEIDRRGL